MRTRLLGTIAAVAAGAGGVVAQTPPPPMPIGVAGGPGMGLMPAGGNGEPIPPQMGGPPGMMGGDPMGGMGGPGMGGPMYPPPGPYGAPPPQDNGAGVHGRIGARFWTDADFLLSFVPRQTVMGPLLTSGPPASRGILGAVGTTVQAGQQNLGYGVFTGFNIHTGWFYDDARRHGIELGGFLTETRKNDTLVSSDAGGQPLYARPFVNATTGLTDALLVTFPTYASGYARVLSTSMSYGAEGSFVTNLFRSCPDGCGDGGRLWDVNLLAGFRYLSLEEELRIDSGSNILGNRLDANGTVVNQAQTAPFDGKSYTGPVTIEVSDRFRTSNRFYGGNVALKSALYLNRWVIQSRLSAAFGLMHEEVTVDGHSSLYGVDATGTAFKSVVPGGLYANSTNIGKYTNDEFGFIPQVDLSLGYQWSSWFSTHVGYNFLYINRVARPGDQYTNVVNPATVPSSFSYGLGNAINVPSPVVSQSDFYLQGVTLGFTVRY